MSEIIIENITQFVEAIRNIAAKDQTELFFRGHADRAYVAEPAIFRNQEHLKNEKHLFNDMITQCPEEFKDCQYTFEYLVKMQHYGLPTRLLDITSNALVALYFACCSLSGEDECKDGQVLVYQVQKDAIKNYNSDTVSVLSNLAQLDSDFVLFTKARRNYLREIEEKLKSYKKDLKLFIDLERIKKLEIQKEVQLKQMNEQFLEMKLSLDQMQKMFRLAQQQGKLEGLQKQGLLEQYRQSENKIKDAISNYPEQIRKLKASIEESPLQDIKRTLEQDITELTQWYTKPEIEEEIKKIQLDIKQPKELENRKERFLHYIKQEKSYFVDRINEEKDVRKVICVRAKLNNSRIIRQSGLFFLFGMGNIKGDPISFLEYMSGMKERLSSTIQEITNPTILISGQAKQTIIKELRVLGISEDTLMPEIDSVAKSIKNRYSH